MEVKLVNIGTANRYNDCIEIHKDLVNYPELYNAILEHENSHTDKKFSLHDLKLDFNRNPKMNYKQLYKFMFKRPRTWVQFLPIWYHKERGFVYDLNLGIIYLIMLLVVAPTTWLYINYGGDIFKSLF